MSRVVSDFYGGGVVTNSGGGVEVRLYEKTNSLKNTLHEM